MGTFEKVQEILAETLNVDKEKISLQSTMTDELGADSLDLVEAVMALENEFGTQFPENDIKELKTVGDVVNYIDQRKVS